VVLECPSQTGGEFMTHALTICLSSLLLLHRVASDDAAVLRKDSSGSCRRQRHGGDVTSEIGRYVPLRRERPLMSAICR